MPLTKPTSRVEEYLESILNMVTEGKAVLAARLAERLGVSAPTVAGALRRMKRDGLVEVDKRKEIRLTEQGERLARTMVRRHRLMERLLTDVLGVSWYEAHDEACLLEHGISDHVEARLYETLGQPYACPHGNPIPTDVGVPPSRGAPLDSMPQGAQVTVTRVNEEAERNRELLQFLHRSGLVPGATFQVKELAAYAGTMTLVGEAGEVSLGLRAAATIWVTNDAGQ